MQFVDSTVIIGLVTNDNPVRTKRLLTLLDSLRNGEIELATTSAVITRAVEQLLSPARYDLGRDQIRTLLAPLLHLPMFQVPGKQAVLRALDLFATLPIGFESALLAAEMERDGIGSVFSYDVDFDKVEFVRRMEP